MICLVGGGRQAPAATPRGEPGLPRGAIPARIEVNQNHFLVANLQCLLTTRLLHGGLGQALVDSDMGHSALAYYNFMTSLGTPSRRRWCASRRRPASSPNRPASTSPRDSWRKPGRILSDKIPCTIGFIKIFLRSPLVYQPCCLVPCCQGKLGELAPKQLSKPTVLFILTFSTLDTVLSA